MQLSPVGPSSHVFLSNRAAALLSLKRYNAAATDARRAIALAPTFGKAHARLGQALYFLKDYEGAVAAYEDAIRFQPDNQVTRTYLEKAKAKLDKQQRKARGEEVSVMSAASTYMYAPSVATDPNHTSGIVTSAYRGHTGPLTAAAGTKLPSNSRSPLNTSSTEDPDFDEALRIQQRANRYLANKEYKAAIEEYTAALFLVPDDPILSPDLHLGRAHALNGSRRHERAKNDAVLAIKLQPSPAAYSTLAKSLFYMKEYRAAIDAFERCTDMLPDGESLGMFDKAYLHKAEAALEEEEASLRKAGLVSGGSSSGSKSTVPKLPPPRFVPREEAIQSTPNLPPMPKEWPQQSPRSASTFRCGPERDITFLSESLGIKLNRGSDGMVRVLWVAQNSPSSPIARQGRIEVGDVVREAAGVDIRRPITNIMWGDTVALIKMAPRPIILTVAKELSEVPPTVKEEIRKANEASPRASPNNASTDEAVYRPSRSSGDGPVRADATQQPVSPSATPTAATDDSYADNVDISTGIAADASPTRAAEAPPVDEAATPPVVHDTVLKEVDMAEDETVLVSDTPLVVDGDRASNVAEEVEVPSGLAVEGQSDVKGEQSGQVEDEGPMDISGHLTSDATKETEPNPVVKKDNDRPTVRDEEERLVGGEILFERSSPAAYSGWDNLRWLSYSGVRKVRFCQPCYRLFENNSKQLFWSKAEKTYQPRYLVIYEEPCVILILRKPTGAAEVHELLGLPDIAELDDAESAVDNYWVAEGVIDPAMCKLRLSRLTTPPSHVPAGSDERRRSCFELISPVESILLSVVRVRGDGKRKEQSYRDSGAFLETSAAEMALSKCLYGVHDQSQDIGVIGADIAWKHQIIIGTLHSLVVAADTKQLDAMIGSALKSIPNDDGRDPNHLPSRLVDELDENGLTALYYACSRRMTGAVASLVAAGARVDFTFGSMDKSLAHICAKNLDDKSLSTILSSPGRRRLNPNAVDALGRTPMYIAATEGYTAGGETDPLALSRCIMALEAWGGQMIVADPANTLESPVSVLASMWRPEELSVVLDHTSYRYPLHNPDSLQKEAVDLSLGALSCYPLHCAMASLRGYVGSALLEDTSAVDNRLVCTLRVLLERGFEPNERIEVRQGVSLSCGDFVGYAPIQVLAMVAKQVEAMREGLEAGAYDAIRSVIEETAEFLVRLGARPSLDLPPAARLRRTASGSRTSGSESSNATFCLESTREVVQLLGGEERLKVPQQEWSDLKPIPATAMVDLLKDDKSSFAESDAPGGSSEKSCAICWKEFGALVNRKHKCRVTRRFVCDGCSSKRLKADGNEFRVSDGQFLLARIDAAKEMQIRQEAEAEQDQLKAAAVKRARSQIRQERLEAEDNTNRDSLFGGMLDQASNFVFGDEEKGPAQKVQGVAASLNQTRDALNQRGEKLASLGEKSSQMVDASSDFARMAKELRKKSEGGLFW